ncbi:MAG: Efflux ABC transporter, permease protein [uncultured Corynebacteriales bacterium]|uniref:Efflux ABC transporter, permease protein n=1 Tax=uncultured Mycobacteriales bacterium TaxID=581187 RepID=A0A6J4J9B8_9ACTN|nr:MAG: Efflux ABC transporter, permease protein [uncultured Corynebacteriales bacterium]
MSAVETLPARPAPVSTRFLRSELGMVFRRRRNQVLLLVLAAIPVIIAVAIKVTTPTGTEADGGPPFLFSITGNGIFVALTSLTVVLPLFLPLAIAVVAGESVAGEASLGTLRYLLVVPVSRTRLLAVKYAGALVYCLVAALLVAAVGTVLGALLFPVGPVTLLSGSTVPYSTGLVRLLLVALYVAAMMAGLAAIGLFVSTLTESPIAAMATTAVLAVTSQVLDSVPQLDWLGPFLFSHYWLNFGDLLRDPVATEGPIRGLLVTAAYVLVFGSLAWSRMTTKDVSS